MTAPDDKTNNPGSRMRNILAGGEEKKRATKSESPLSHLPRARPVSSALPALSAAQPKPVPEPKPASRFSGKNLLSTFWTIGSAVSITVNVVLIAILLIVLRRLGGLNANQVGTGLLGGLYTNFEKMDQAHIKTTIPVQTNVPVRLDVCIKTGTDVVINRDVTIPGARVTVQTGGLNIVGATSTIVLPSNAVLPVNLDLCVPVETTMPVTLDVPVDIPLASTDLHPAILGLQETIKPLYCMVEKNAISLTGEPICR